MAIQNTIDSYNCFCILEAADRARIFWPFVKDVYDDFQKKMMQYILMHSKSNKTNAEKFYTGWVYDNNLNRCYKEKENKHRAYTHNIYYELYFSNEKDNAYVYRDCSNKSNEELEVDDIVIHFNAMWFIRHQAFKDADIIKTLWCHELNHVEDHWSEMYTNSVLNLRHVAYNNVEPKFMADEYGVDFIDVSKYARFRKVIEDVQLAITIFSITENDSMLASFEYLLNNMEDNRFTDIFNSLEKNADYNYKVNSIISKFSKQYGLGIAAYENLCSVFEDKITKGDYLVPYMFSFLLVQMDFIEDLFPEKYFSSPDRLNKLIRTYKSEEYNCSFITDKERDFMVRCNKLYQDEKYKLYSEFEKILTDCLKERKISITENDWRVSTAYHLLDNEGVKYFLTEQQHYDLYENVMLTDNINEFYSVDRKYNTYIDLRDCFRNIRNVPDDGELFESSDICPEQCRKYYIDEKGNTHINLNRMSVNHFLKE